MVGMAPSATEEGAEGPQKRLIGHGGPIRPLSLLEELEEGAKGPQKCPIGHGGPIGPLSPLEKLEGGAWSALNF